MVEYGGVRRVILLTISVTLFLWPLNVLTTLLVSVSTTSRVKLSHDTPSIALRRERVTHAHTQSSHIVAFH